MHVFSSRRDAMNTVCARMLAVVLGFGIFFDANIARADLTINFGQYGSDVIATTSGGTYNLNSGSNTLVSGPGWGIAFVAPGINTMFLGKVDVNSQNQPTNYVTYNNNFTFNSASPFNLTAYFPNSYPSSVTGSPFGFYSGHFVLLPKDSIINGISYIGSSTTTFANTTIAAMGLYTGTYVFSNDNAAGTFTTINISSTPEPSSYALMGLGLCCLAAGYGYRRRMRIAA